MQTTRQIALPFAEKDEVSVTRTRKILGVSNKAVFYLIAHKQITAFRRGHLGNFFVSYPSLVAYCDRLRVKYEIPDLRPKREGIFGRYRDHELLPFPLEETITVETVADVLRYSVQRARMLCEEGRFLSYKLHEQASWRISRPSFESFVDAINKQVAS
jgi:hypothetical protein